MLDWGGSLHGFHLQGGADIGQSARPKREGLWVICLPPLVFGPQVKGARVLEVDWEDDMLVTSFSGQLYTEVPGVEGDKGPLEIVVGEVFLMEGLESLDGGSKISSVPNVVPGDGGQAR